MCRNPYRNPFGNLYPLYRVLAPALLLPIFLVAACASEPAKFSEETYERYPELRPQKTFYGKVVDATTSAIDAIIAAPSRVAGDVRSWGNASPFDASTLTIERFRLPPGTRYSPSKSAATLAPDAVQTLTLDLITGRGSIRDIDTRAYNYQVRTHIAASLKDTLSDRAKWTASKKIVSAPGTAEPYYYRLSVQPVSLTQSEAKNPPSAAWVVPARENKKSPPPAVFGVLTDIFEQAHRTIYPIANDVDLLSRSN